MERSPINELDESMWSNGDMDLLDTPFIGIPGINVDIKTDANELCFFNLCYSEGD